MNERGQADAMDEPAAMPRRRSESADARFYLSARLEMHASQPIGLAFATTVVSHAASAASWHSASSLRRSLISSFTAMENLDVRMRCVRDSRMLCG